MDAVTYPNAKVIDFITHNLIPLRLLADQQPWATNFNIRWTPALIMLDRSGQERARTVGFLSPEELIPSLMLGLGAVYSNKDDYQEAIRYYDEVLADYPASDSAPEALFQRGVSRYKASHDPTPLKEAYLDLQAKYPASHWTKRAYPYRLIG